MKLRPLAFLLLPLAFAAQTTAPATGPTTQTAGEIMREKWQKAPVIQNKAFDDFLDTIPADCWPDLKIARPKSSKDLKDRAFADRWSTIDAERSARVREWGSKNILGKEFTFTAVSTVDSVPNGNEESNRFSFTTHHKGKVVAVIHTVGLPRVKVGQKFKITGTYSKTQPFSMGVQSAEDTDIVYINLVLRDCKIEKLD